MFFARVVASVVVLLPVVGVVAQIALDKERKTLDATARAEAPGKFARLHDDMT